VRPWICRGIRALLHTRDSREGCGAIAILDDVVSNCRLSRAVRPLGPGSLLLARSRRGVRKSGEALNGRTSTGGQARLIRCGSPLALRRKPPNGTDKGCIRSLIAAAGKRRASWLKASRPRRQIVKFLRLPSGSWSWSDDVDPRCSDREGEGDHERERGAQCA
jgi:hypothetical protein